MRRIVLALAMLLAAAIGTVPGSRTTAATTVGPKTYYLALGDSLGYGYQPNGDFSHGYADDLYAHYAATHPTTTHFTNMSCPDESSTTFIKGGCPYWYIRKTFYLGSQLNAALSFIKNHSGQVSPVTVDIGANDFLPLITTSSSGCTVSSTWPTALATFDANFKTILSKLKTALNGKGDLIAMNYYNPYQDECASSPDVMADLQTLNSHIASDAQAYSVPVADVFTAFGGATTSNICTYTWMCSSYNDVHATGTGYGVIAGAFQSAEGY
jgi:lysophospholipase L1-like esterase